MIFNIFLIVFREFFESNMQNGAQDERRVIHVKAGTTRTGPISKSTCTMLGKIVLLSD
jgi:hypothetical protein